VIFNIREHRTVYDVIKEAHQAGVVFKVCSPTLEMWGSELIAEIDETIGTAYIIEEAMSDDTITFTY
jgi:predicted peroxiredoxin